MSGKITASSTASADVHPTPTDTKAINTVTYSGPVDGTATAGTITINCKAPGSTVFESPKDSSGAVLNTIDIAAPEKLNIPGEITQYEITVAGFAGTASLIDLTVSSYGA